jgi:hypothetical protein
MSDVQRLKIDLGQPRHGSLDVELSAGDRTYKFFPSYTPYDSIGELARALLVVLNGDKAIARWNDEPDEHEFIFEPQENQIMFQVNFIPDPVVTRRGLKREPEQVFIFTSSAYEVIRPFWKALRDLQSRQSREEFKERWRGEFPERDVMELTERLKKRKGK